MKYNNIRTLEIHLLAALPLLGNAASQKMNISRSAMVRKGIAKSIPEGFDAKKVPSSAIGKEPCEQKALSSGWNPIPDFTLTDGKVNDSLNVDIRYCPTTVLFSTKLPPTV